jgi:nucleotide-binding universal stress UspA family protein
MYKVILVPLDGSKRAEAILPHVESMALRYGAELIFLQIISPVGAYQSLTAPDYHYREAFEKHSREAELYLTKLVDDFHAKGISAIKMIDRGRVVETIIKIAADMNVDLIAFSSHGLSGIKRVFYGGVASGLLGRIDRPLLLIRSREYER